MRSSRSFVAFCVGVVFLGTTGAALFADGGVQGAVLVAGLVVLGTQLPLHFILRRWRERDDRFMAAIVTGFAARVGVLALAVALFVIPERLAAAPFLLALGGFMLAVLLGEAAIEGRRARGRPDRGAKAAAS